jgi:hypothetical protein
VSVEQRATLADAAIQLHDPPVTDLFIEDDEITAVLADTTRHKVEVLYPALGSLVRSDLAVALGARCGQSGYIEVDAHQRTSVPGVYAAGDVVNELNQICVATGHAAIAATDIYNTLRSAGRDDLALGRCVSRGSVCSSCLDRWPGRALSYGFLSIDFFDSNTRQSRCPGRSKTRTPAMEAEDLPSAEKKYDCVPF